jgi:hypothetical protein
MAAHLITTLSEHLNISSRLNIDGATYISKKSIALYSDGYVYFRNSSHSTVKVITLRVYLKLWRLF